MNDEHRRATGRATLTTLTNALRAILWCAVAAEVAWLALSAMAGGALSSVMSVEGRALAHLLVLCALCLSSGFLLALERRASTAGDPASE